MKHLRVFENYPAYEAEAGTLARPNVSYCRTENRVYYMQSLGDNGYEYVDLGLPSGLLWATKNVGAEDLLDPGLYFMWGDTTGYTKAQINSGSSGNLDYTWNTYKYCNGSETTLTKYCNDSTYGNEDFVDNLTTLDLSDDAVRANWGGKWKMPTTEQVQELLDNCTQEIVQGSMSYVVLTGPNGNTVTFPAGGEAYTSGAGRPIVYYYGGAVDMWTASTFIGNCRSAVDVGGVYYGLPFAAGNVPRYYGLPVRGVLVQ